jgi:SM-20-related protein
MPSLSDAQAGEIPRTKKISDGDDQQYSLARTADAPHNLAPGAKWSHPKWSQPTRMNNRTLDPAKLNPSPPFNENEWVEALTQHGWHLMDNFVNREFQTKLISEMGEMASTGAFQPAGIGRGLEKRIDPRIRGDRIAWLESTPHFPAHHDFLQRLEQLRHAINQRLFLGLFESETHGTIYDPGSCYEKHMDNFRGQSLRTLTAILYLNIEWKVAHGGELRLYFEDDSDTNYIDIPPIGGRLVTFFSDLFPHEVLTTRNERLSITTWFSQRQLP